MPSTVHVHHHFSPPPSVTSLISHSIQVSCLQSRLKNLLHFLEYFDDKIISVKNFPLGFVKFDPLIYLLFFVFLHKCGKILKRKDRANILRHLESCHVASKSSLFQVSSFIKCCRRCANGSRSIARVQQ